jgi:hypothetical protein
LLNLTMKQRQKKLQLKKLQLKRLNNIKKMQLHLFLYIIIL